MKPRKTLIAAGATIPLIISVSATGVLAKVTLTYWEKWGAFEQQIITGIIDKFNKSQSNIFVKYVYQPDPFDKYLASCAAGSPPDLVGAWNHTLQPFVLNNVAQPLDTYLKVMGLSSKSLIPSYWDMMNYKSKIYGMPVTPACFATYWNKTLFAEAGLDPERPPKTMDDIVVMNDKLSKKNANGKYSQIGFSPSLPGWYPYMWPVAFGADIYDEGKEAIDFSQPGMARTYKWVAAISSKFDGPKGLTGFTNSYLSKGGPFISGKAAIDIMGSFNPSYLAKYNPTMKYGVDELPVGQGGVNWSWIEGDVVFLPRSGKHNKEAAQFLGYLMRPDIQREFQLQRETFSVIREANTPDFIAKNKNPFIKEILRAANSQKGAYIPKTIAWGDEMWNVYGDLFNKVFNQTKSIDQALKEAQSAADTLIARKVKKTKK